MKFSRGVAWKALEAGLIFLNWREALSSEEPVGGASGTGMMDAGVVVAAFTAPGETRGHLSSSFRPKRKDHGRKKAKGGRR